LISLECNYVHIGKKAFRQFVTACPMLEKVKLCCRGIAADDVLYLLDQCKYVSSIYVYFTGCCAGFNNNNYNDSSNVANVHMKSLTLVPYDSIDSDGTSMLAMVLLILAYVERFASVWRWPAERDFE